MADLRWQNIAGPNYGASNQLRVAGSNQLTKGIDAFGQIAKDQNQLIRDAEARNLQEQQLGMQGERLKIAQGVENRAKAEYEGQLAADAQRGVLGGIDSYSSVTTPEQIVPLTAQQEIARAKEIEVAANAIDAELKDKHLQDPVGTPSEEKQAFSKLTGIKDVGAGNEEEKSLFQRWTGIDVDKLNEDKKQYKVASTKEAKSIDKEFTARIKDTIKSADLKYTDTVIPASTTKGGLKSEKDYATDLRKKAVTLKRKAKTDAEKRGIDLLLKERLTAHQSTLGALAAIETKSVTGLEDYAAKQNIKQRITGKGTRQAGDVSQKDVADAKGVLAGLKGNWWNNAEEKAAKEKADAIIEADRLNQTRLLRRSQGQ